MSLKTLIPTLFQEEWEKNLENELVIDILSATKYDAIVKRDGSDEINVRLPGEVSVKRWGGGDLADPEKVALSIAKIKIDKGCQINFALDHAQAVQISGSSLKEAKQLSSVYSRDAVQKFAENIDRDLAKLYPVAGIWMAGASDAAITLTVDNAAKFLSVMKARFSRAKAWKTGKMVAICPPELTALFNQVPGLMNSEKGFEDRKKGFVRELAGWKIYESNNVVTDSSDDDVFYPLFGIRGESMASAKEKNIDLIHYIPEKGLDDAFKGAGMYGVGCPRPDKLGAAKVKVNLSM